MPLVSALYVGFPCQRALQGYGPQCRAVAGIREGRRVPNLHHRANAMGPPRGSVAVGAIAGSSVRGRRQALSRALELALVHRLGIEPRTLRLRVGRSAF